MTDAKKNWPRHHAQERADRFLRRHPLLVAIYPQLPRLVGRWSGKQWRRIFVIFGMWAIATILMGMVIYHDTDRTPYGVILLAWPVFPIIHLWLRPGDA